MSLTFNCEGCGCKLQVGPMITATQILEPSPRLALFCTDFENREKCVGETFIDLETQEAYLKGPAYAKYLAEK